MHYFGAPFAWRFFGWCFGTGPASTICFSVASNAVSSSGQPSSLATCSNCGVLFVNRCLVCLLFATVIVLAIRLYQPNTAGLYFSAPLAMIHAL